MKVNCHLLLQTGPFSQYSLRPNRQQLSLDFCLNFKFSSSPFLNVHNVKINCTISIVWLPFIKHLIFLTPQVDVVLFEGILTFYNPEVRITPSTTQSTTTRKRPSTLFITVGDLVPSQV